jgi:hypothetical protein
VRGQRDHRAAPQAARALHRAQFLHGLHAAHHRHVEVHEDHVGPLPFGRGQRHAAVDGGLHRERRRRQEAPHDQQVVLVVVHQQHAQAAADGQLQRLGAAALGGMPHAGRDHALRRGAARR